MRHQKNTRGKLRVEEEEGGKTLAKNWREGETHSLRPIGEKIAVKRGWEEKVSSDA